MSPARWVPFAYGFRPFFLLAGLSAAVGVGAWLWVYAAGKVPMPGLAPQAWHGHEMLFGFVVAAIAGFLLTAVPSWTGSRGFAGAPLVALTLAWLAGRVGFLLAGVLPAAALAVLELAFLPALTLTLAPALLRSTNRNTPLLAVLIVLWLADAAFVTGLARGDAALASAALRAGLGLVLVLITVIGGRIVPSFTRNALRAAGQDVRMPAQAAGDRLAIALTVAFAIADTVAPFATVTGAVAALAAAVHAWRLGHWHGLRTGRQPIVWILHVGYAWLVIGLGLKSAFVLADAAWAMHWQHALGAGAAGTMILAVMTRAALGHTGRALTASTTIVWAYVALTGAAVVRVFGSTLWPQAYVAVVAAAGILWIIAFVLFLVVYAPILTRPRADGRPG